MGKLWDALKQAEREGNSDLVSEYENQFEQSPEDFSGDFSLHLTANMVEEYRKLFHMVRRISEEQANGMKLLMVTAPSFGEGVTTVATSLAAALAHDKRSRKVLLMDFNLRQPGIHELFNYRPAPGIVEAMLDHEHRMDFFRASPLREAPNLHLLTAGNIDLIETNPVEIVEHEYMRPFLDELRGFYDIVIIDCAPVIQYSDAVSLAPLVDGSVLVIDSSSTRWEVAVKARDQLTFADANLLGVVLNKRKMVIPNVIYRRL